MMIVALFYVNVDSLCIILSIAYEN